jgi:nitrite reductase/ring-hydroxylating ferredoxin subunit
VNTAPHESARSGHATLRVGRVDEFPIGVFTIVRAAGREVGVIQLSEGTFRAVLNRCPHRGAPVCAGVVGGTWPPCETASLAFSMKGRVLVCPWHGWEFDLITGHALFATRPAHLRLFETSVDDGIVSVDLPSGDPAR